MIFLMFSVFLTSFVLYLLYITAKKVFWLRITLPRRKQYLLTSLFIFLYILINVMTKMFWISEIGIFIESFNNFQCLK